MTRWEAGVYLLYRFVYNVYYIYIVYLFLCMCICIDPDVHIFAKLNRNIIQSKYHQTISLSSRPKLVGAGLDSWIAGSVSWVVRCVFLYITYKIKKINKYKIESTEYG